MDDKVKIGLSNIADGISLQYGQGAAQLRPLIDETVGKLFESMLTGLEARIGDRGYIEQLARFATQESSILIHSDAMDKVFAEAKAFCNGRTRGKVVSAADLKEQLLKFYHNGYSAGLKMRLWPNLSEKYRVAKREFTVVTGIPGHGKSSFMDALMVSLAEEYGWNFAVYSPENFPFEIHLEKLISLAVRLPFHDGPQARMSTQDVVDSLAWVSEHFTFIHPDEDNISLEAVLSLCLQAKEERRVDGFIIDPWNELEHNRPQGKSETEYIGEALSKCRRFARRNDIAIWIVAHPTKIQENDDGSFKVPTPYSISGSSNWYNKADNCITVYRDALNAVQVYIQKIKYKIRGEVGCCYFSYDRATGIFRPGGDSAPNMLPPPLPPKGATNDG